MKKQDDNTFAMILEHVQTGTAEAPATPVSQDSKEHWSDNHDEGKLAVDVSQDEKYIFVVSTMAGAVPEKIEVYVHNDLLTIRGFREDPLKDEKEIDYFYQECYWGIFSRTIVLPVDVKGDLSHAKYQNGILTVKIPKQDIDTKIKVEIVDE